MKTLKQIREEAALSVFEIAQACGVKRQTIWLWEQGKARPSPSHRRKLAEIFQCTPKDILDAVNASRKEYEKDRAAA